MPQPLLAALGPTYRSELRSGNDTRRRHYRVPDWAGALTPDWVERAVLGVVDYWLEPKGGDQVRATGAYHHRGEDGFDWYVVSARQIARQLFGDVYQVRRALTRLARAGFLHKGTHTVRGRNVGVRLRLDWPTIDATVASVWGVGVDIEGE